VNEDADADDAELREKVAWETVCSGTITMELKESRPPFTGEKWSNVTRSAIVHI